MHGEMCRVLTIFVTCEIVCFCGCRALPTRRPLTESERTALYEQTHREFQNAAFLKPRDGSMADQPFACAPLIVQEIPPESDARQTSERFGAVIIDEAGQVTIDANVPTVYTTSSSIEIAGRLYDQLSYRWAYPPATKGGTQRWRGFRETFGSDGFPVIFEVLSSDAKTTVLYVSQSLASASEETFHSPLPNRRFTIEPPLAEHPNVVVARVLEDGPQPMGPYVYLSHDNLTMTTLICRCMPAQFNAVVENDYYDLVPLTSFNELGIGIEADMPAASAHLERMLRLPADF